MSLGEGALFRNVKPVDGARSAGSTLGQRADDVPAYIALFVTGHLLAPVLIFLVAELALGAIAIVAIIIPLAVVMLVALLQPSKGAVIGMQWWNGMHGFRKERRPEADEDAAG